MNIDKLLERLSYTVIREGKTKEITGFSVNTKNVTPGCAFICIKGARFDAHTCISKIDEFGAALIVISDEYAAGGFDASGISATVISVPDTRLAKAMIAAAWYGYPAEKMVTVGITGSKGKTTTTHMLSDIISRAGNKVVTIGTNGFILDGHVTELANTTPDSEDIQKYLAQAADAGCTHAVIECSSQGLMQHRTGGFTFDYGIFTNISEGDHVGPNEHKSFEEYLFCKGLLLKGSRQAVVYAGDGHIDDLLKDVDTPTIFYADDQKTYRKPDYIASGIKETYENDLPGIAFDISGGFNAHINVNLPGRFNVCNAMAAVVVAHLLGISESVMNEALTHLKIKGRFDMILRTKELSVCVDFAHNGYSTRNHLEALREYRPKRIVCVFGADGNRSKHRRYEMGEASGRLADFSIITSGHNRYESFETILADIMIGMNKTKAAGEKNYLVIKDRKEAVRYAIENAKEGDLITILGLGHESYQEENGVKTPYSDTEYAREVLRSLGKM